MEHVGARHTHRLTLGHPLAQVSHPTPTHQQDTPGQRIVMDCSSPINRLNLLTQSVYCPNARRPAIACRPLVSLQHLHQAGGSWKGRQGRSHGICCWIGLCLPVARPAAACVSCQMPTVFNYFPKIPLPSAGNTQATHHLSLCPHFTTKNDRFYRQLWKFTYGTNGCLSVKTSPFPTTTTRQTQGEDNLILLPPFW